MAGLPPSLGLDREQREREREREKERERERERGIERRGCTPGQLENRVSPTLVSVCPPVGPGSEEGRACTA